MSRLQLSLDDALRMSISEAIVCLCQLEPSGGGR